LLLLVWYEAEESGKGGFTQEKSAYSDLSRREGSAGGRKQPLKPEGG